MKRNIVEKFLHLGELQSRYEDQMVVLAEKQLEIDAKIIKEYGLQDEYDYKDIVHYVDGDYHHLKVHSNGEIGIWENAFRGDPPSHCSSFNLSTLIMEGKLDEYEQAVRTSWKKRADDVAEYKAKLRENRRKSLQVELEQLTKKIEEYSS